MHPTLQVQAIELRVPDLARSVDFYSRQLGFGVLRQAGGRAELATAVDGAVVLTLIEDRTARRAPTEAAGLFHAALLLPDRAALGNWLRRAAEQGVRFEGFSDHGVSEALYLSDPDGNGLEFYSDRPRDAWPRAKNGTDLAMYTRPLDLDNLMAAGAAGRADALLTGARWGHLHLSVTNLDHSETFYKSALGMSLMVSLGDSARFLAADGYHHHLGLNTWARATKPQPAGALGLASATFAKAGMTAEQRLSDPDGMAIRVVPM
jgi:catechol 2,3-dioxygenase